METLGSQVLQESVCVRSANWSEGFSMFCVSRALYVKRGCGSAPPSCEERVWFHALVSISLLFVKRGCGSMPWCPDPSFL